MIQRHNNVLTCAEQVATRRPKLLPSIATLVSAVMQPQAYARYEARLEAAKERCIQMESDLRILKAQHDLPIDDMGRGGARFLCNFAPGMSTLETFRFYEERITASERRCVEIEKELRNLLRQT